MKSFNLTEWALGHRALVLFLMLAIVIGGVVAFTKLGQLEDPNFSVPSMTAIVIWPGATAQQIQDEVMNRMEKKFEQLDHFEKVVTYSRQGYGGMTITVVGGTSHADQREAWYQVRKKFNDIKLELPQGVIGPIFNDEYGDVTGLLYAVKGDGVSQWELSDVAEDIKQRLLKVPMVKKVDIYGKQAKKVYVEFSNERLAALGITPLAIAESLRNQNSVEASGSIDTDGDRVFVRVSGQFASLEDIRNVPIAAGGRQIKLGDFTTITRGYEDPPTYTVRHNGQQVLMLGIVMTGDGNIVELGKAIEKAVARVQAELPYGVELERVADQPTVVSDSIWEFERSLLEALSIVLAVSLLSLGWRTGIVVGLSVPIVLCVVALVMLSAGWNLDRVSLGSLIIALGLLVDDGIIAVEMMVVKMEAGLGASQGGRVLLLGDRDAAADRRAHHRRRLHADRVRQVDHRRVRRRHLLDRRHGRAVLVGRVGDHHALPRGQHAAEGFRQAAPRRRPVRHAVLPQAARLDRSRPRAALVGHRRDGGRTSRRRDGRQQVRAAAVLPQQRPARAGRRAATEGRRFVRRDHRAGEEDGSRAEAGRRRAFLHRLHGRRPAALLSRAQSGVAEPGLRRLHRHDEGHAGT